MADWYWYEQTGDGTVRLLRVFGTSPEIVVPEEIDGHTVTGLGAYCFAEKRGRVSEYHICTVDMAGDRAGEEFRQLCRRGRIRELSGEYVQRVTLPTGIVSMGNCCFYQCSNLEELILGNRLLEIGSDAFMNCHKLRKFQIQGSAACASGLKQILSQRSPETEVCFVGRQGIETALLYPEYSETYDEIGPAHIFELNIEGEGFRARQCFHEGIVDLAQYDSIFRQACAGESERTLCRMAWLRLYYQTGLRKENRQMYGDYIREHAESAGRFLVEEKNLELLYFAGENGYFGKHEVSECIRYAVSKNWTEGAGMLLQYQKKWFAKEEKEEYSFEDF